MSSGVTTDCVRFDFSAFSPKHRSMIRCSNRVNSFKSWPHQLRQTPYELARDGFLYEGVSDRVTCFMCGVTLQHWDYLDIVEFEHSRWSKDCKYLQITVPH